MEAALHTHASQHSYHNQYLTAKIGDQLFGLPVFNLRDIFKCPEITPIPLTPKYILGSINLRGKIVTVIDLRERFNIQNYDSAVASMNIAVEYGQEVLSLVVDSVGEVIYIPPERFEQLPPTLEKKWRNISEGVCQLNKNLLVGINMDKLLELITNYIPE